jgi:hypothetical protein
VEGTDYEPATGQAPTQHTTNQQPSTNQAADPLSGSSVQCSVFRVPLDEAQPTAERRVSSDHGGSSTASGVASAPSNPLEIEANSFLPTEPNDHPEVARDNSDPGMNPVESQAPDAAGSDRERENVDVARPDTAPARPLPAAMELLLSIILVISCALWCLSASAAEARVRLAATRPPAARDGAGAFAKGAPSPIATAHLGIFRRRPSSQVPRRTGAEFPVARALVRAGSENFWSGLRLGAETFLAFPSETSEGMTTAGTASLTSG